MKILEKLTKILKSSLFCDRWTCNACGREIFSGYFCSECSAKIIEINENKCRHCGRYAAHPVEYCDSCIEKNINFDVARSVFEYLEPISYLVQNFKYKNVRYLGDFFAEKMASVYKREGLTCDFVTFVPMHEKRLRKREYNQAKILAEKFAKLTGVEIKDCIEKVRETENQVKLSFKERTQNLKGSFKVKKSDVCGKKILVIDDVLTTGSTVDLIALELKKKGAEKVSVLTLASVSKGRILKN